MRTATPNLIILTVEIGTNITGTAIDADILINFAVANTEVNQRLFVPEAQLVVTGKFRLGKELATIGIWISRVVAIISIPALAESSASVETVVEHEIATITVEDGAPVPTSSVPKQTRAQKAASTRAAKKAKAKAESVSC